MRIAVYTCITGNYDMVMDPKVTENECSYFLISDDRPQREGIYRWIDVNTIVPDKGMTPKDKNRYCKMHPFMIFPDYDYSIYLDGSIQIVNGIAHSISDVGITGLAMHRHRKSNDIYSESIFLTWLGAVEKEKMLADIERYITAGFPRNFGLFECGVIVTDLHNPIAKELYQKWYEEYNRSAKRDQQSFVYTLWSMGYTAKDVGKLGGGYNVYTNPDIHWNRGSHYRC